MKYQGENKGRGINFVKKKYKKWYLARPNKDENDLTKKYLKSTAVLSSIEMSPCTINVLDNPFSLGLVWLSFWHKAKFH